MYLWVYRLEILVISMEVLSIAAGLVGARLGTLTVALHMVATEVVEALHGIPTVTRHTVATGVVEVLHGIPTATRYTVITAPVDRQIAPIMDPHFIVTNDTEI